MRGSQSAPSSSLARAWFRVHRAREGFVAIAGASVVLLVAGRLVVHHLGPVSLGLPAPVALFVPLLLGSGVAIAAANEVDRTVPTIARATWPLRQARAAWLLGLGVLVCLVPVLAHPLIPDASVGAQVRNVLLFSALATMMTVAGCASLAWLPVAILVIAGMLVGVPASGTDPAPWAVFLQPVTSRSELEVAIVIWLAVVVAYALHGGEPRRGAEH